MRPHRRHPVARTSRPRPIAVTLVAIAMTVSACGGTSPTTSPPSPGPATSGPATAEAGPPLETLRIRHPQNLAFAAPFHLIESGGELDELATNVDVAEWSTPDVLRAMLVNGESEVTAVPTYVGANLANQGVDVSLAAVVVWGLLWVVGPDGTAVDWESLRGQTVMIPFPNDMPDLVFRYLATANGLVPGEDVEIEYFAQPPEVVSRLVSGRGKWAVLPEHTATVALSQARQARQNEVAVGRVLDLQEEWASATGTEPRIPQAGIVVPTSLAEERPQLVGAVLDELTRAVQEVNAADAATVAELSAATGVPEPVVADVIPRLNLEVVPAADARDELERFYTELTTLSPDIIGGQLPDAEFYVDDPR